MCPLSLLKPPSHALSNTAYYLLLVTLIFLHVVETEGFQFLNEFYVVDLAEFGGFKKKKILPLFLHAV